MLLAILLTSDFLLFPLSPSVQLTRWTHWFQETHFQPDQGQLQHLSADTLDLYSRMSNKNAAVEATAAFLLDYSIHFPHNLYRLK